MICPACEEPAIIDPDYWPPRGLDPNLRRYICTNPQCQNVFYYLSRKTTKKDDDLAGQAKLV
jgi:hypothetical protein